MIFARIGRSLALQFTAFVFALFLVNGAMFLVADFGNAKRQSGFRLSRDAHAIIDHPDQTLRNPPQSLPPFMRDRVRILDENGDIAYSGNVFNDIPVTATGGTFEINLDDEHYTVLSLSIYQGRELLGFVQVADIQRIPLGDLPFRALIYIIVSILISALTYVVGRMFARSSLKPAEEMLERLEQFTQDASHELRTPIAVLGSSLDVALKSGQYKEGIVSAKEDLAQLAVLTEKLLELARLGDFGAEKERLDLSELVGDTVKKFEPLAREKSVTMTEDIALSVTVNADAALLRQVLTNLLSNALKFNHSGGTITVTLTKSKLSIADTGIGISPRDLPNIFDRFYQADNSRAHGGYGLGLALVRRIVELHGWHIGVASKEGKGTMFTVTFGKRQGK